MNRIYKVIWNEVRHCYMVASELTRTHTKPASVHKEGTRKSQKALTLAVLITLTSAALMWTPVAYADSGEDYIGVAHYKYADGTEINDEGGLNYNGRGTYTIGESATVSEKKGVTGAITVGVDAGAGKKTVTIGDRYANQSAYSVLLGQQSRYARLTYDGVQKSKETIGNPSKIGVDTEESIGTGVIAIGYNSRASNKDSLNTSEDYKTYDAANIGDQSVTDNFKEMAYDTATSSVTKKAVANTLKTNGAGGAIAIGYNAKADGGNIAIGTNATAFRKNDTDDSYVSFGNDGYVETIYLEGTTTTDGTTTQNTATVWHDGVNRRLTHVAAGSSANEAATVGQVISLVGDTYTNGNEITFNTTYKEDDSGNYLDDYGNVVYTKNSDGTYHETSDTANDESTTTDFSKAAKIYEVAVNPTGTVSADDTSKVVSGAAMYTELRPENGNYVQKSNTTAANLKALDSKIGTISTPATTTTASTGYNYINTDANTSISQNLVNLDQKVKAAIDATTYTAGDSITISGDKNAISVNHILRQDTTGASVGTGSWVIGGDATDATGTTGATGNSAVTIGGSGNILASGQNSVVVGGTSGKAVGKNSVNIGGSNGYADGENSVAIGGGITSTNSAIAIGSGAVATKSNSMAIGYQSVADDENTIAFGHDANDETGAVNSSGQKYGTASYNRLVKVAYGQNNHDVATMAQRTKLTTTTDNNAPITVSVSTDNDTKANTYTVTANTGDVGAGKTTLVTGDAVNTAIATETSARESADKDLSNRIGTLSADGNYILKGNDVSKNLSVLDGQVKTNADNISTNKTNIENLKTQLDGNIYGSGANITVDSDKKVNLNKELTDLTSAAFGTNGTTVDENGVKIGSNTTLASSGLTLGTGDSSAKFTTNGISAGDQQIANLASGRSSGTDDAPVYETKTNAANIGDVQSIVGSVKTELNQTISTNTTNISKNSTDITNLSTKINNLSDGAVQYDSAEKNTVTLKGTDGTKLTNLKDADLSDTSTDAVTGKQLYTTKQNLATEIADRKSAITSEITARETAVNNEASARSTEDTALSSRIGTLTSDGYYIKKSETNNVSQNLTALDNQVKANADSIANNTTNITNLQNGEGFTDAGNTYLKNLSKDAVKVAAGDRVNVDTAEDTDGKKTYTVSAKNDGKVESGNTHLVSGDTVNTAIQSAISGQQTQLNADLAKKADVDAGNLTEANVTSWQNALGGSIAENNAGFVRGKDVYQEIHVDTDGSYVKASNTVAQNLSSLDSQVKTNADAISTNAANITKNAESISKNAENITKNTTSITNNTTAITNLQNGEGFTAAGNTYLKNLSKNAVKVAAGDRVNVDAAEDADGNKTYTVSAKNDGKVESGNTNLVSGDTVNTAIQSAISGQQTQLNADLAKKADADAGNLTKDNVASWQNKLGGSIAENNAGFVSGKDVYKEVRLAGDGNYAKASNTAAQNLSVLDTQVKTNANSILSLQTQVEGNVYSAGDGLTLTGKTFSAKAADSNVQISAAGIGLNPVLTNLTSASFGTSGTILDADGLTLGSGKDAAKFTNAGISAGNQQIKNLKAGTEENDAVTVAQLMDYVAENENISITDSGKTSTGQQKKTISVNTTGAVKSGDSHIVTGHTMYQELRPEDGSYIQASNATAKNLQALDNKLGKLSKENAATVTPVVTPLANLKTMSAANINILTANALSDDYNYLEKNVTISKNLENLDEKVKADITANAYNIAANTTRIDALANSLANLPAAGNTSQTGGSTTVPTFKGDNNILVTNPDGSEVTIQLEENQNLGENGSVRFGDEDKATMLNKDGLQVKDNNGNTAASVTKDGISATQVTVSGTDGKNIVIDKNGLDMGGKTISNVGSGIVNDANGKRDDAKSKNNVANIGDVNTIVNDNLQQTRNLINETSDGEKTTINIGHSSSATSIDIARQVTDNGTTTRTNRVITGVMTDVSDATSAANVAYVNEVNAQSTQQIYRSMNSAYNRVENDISKATAGANALAALHPMEMDPEDKLQFAMGYGHYRNANAAAVGAFYTPNENMMLSIGTSFGNGDMGVNAGVTFKVGSGSNTPSLSKKQMARVINAQSQQIEAMQKAEAEKNQRIDMLAAENKEIKEKLAQILARLDAQK